MTVSNRVPASGLTLNFAEQFSFEVTDGYASLLVRVTTEGGVLEAVYDSGDGGAAPGYTVSVEDLGATIQLVCTRDSGWSIDPTQVHVTEDGVTTSWSYDIFPTREYPEGMQPYNDPDASAITATVDSWEGRTGNVVAQADDYPASEVTNDSGVTGAYVDDALDKLATDIAAIPVPNYPVDTVHARTGDVVSVKGDYTGSEVTIATLGTPDIDTVQEVIDHALGVGHISGGDFTDNGDGTIIVGAGTGFLRAVNGDDEPVYSMGWTEVPAQALTDNSINFIYVEYNAGTPQVAASTTIPTDLNTNLLLWSVYRSGNFLHQTPNRYNESNLAREINRRLYNVDGTTHSTGAAISDTGTLHFAITAGTFYLGLNVAEWTAEDTAVSSTFLDFYSDGASGWTLSSGNSVIDNAYWDDGTGTLNTLTTNRYGVHWVYVSPHDQDIYVVYGTGDYTRTQAEQALAPSVLPPHIDYWHGVLAGKIIVNEGDTELFSVESAFVKLFLSGGVADHGDLTGLADDDHTQYHNDTRGDVRYGPKADVTANTSRAPLTGAGDPTAWGGNGKNEGHIYVDTTADASWILVDATIAANIWEEVTTPGGATDHGALTGLTDDDHVRYVDVDGTRPQDAARITHRAAKVNVTNATECELWARTATSYDEPMWTCSGGLDWTMLRAYNPIDRTIPFWNIAATGDYCTVDADFAYNNSWDELIMGGAPAISLDDRTTTPTPVAGAGKLYARSDYHEPTIQHNAWDADGHDPTWLAPDGTETNLGWQARNLPLSLGSKMWFNTSASINAPIGGTNKTTADANVSFIYDDLSNHWYNSWFDASLGDYIACDSADGITWSARKTIDSSTTQGDMSWIATTGTVCGAACDGLFYRSTNLTVASLAYKNSVPSATESTMLFWHSGSSVWVHVGYSGATAYIHTAPDSSGTMTWTQRWTSSSYGLLVAGDIQRDPEGVSKSALGYPERICLWSSTNSAMVYTTGSTATSWSVDTSSQPTIGLNVAHYCPGMGTQYANSGGGGWYGIDTTGLVWAAASASAGTWSATTYYAGVIFKSTTWQGWSNNAQTLSSCTVYDGRSMDNVDANCQLYSSVGVQRDGHSFLSLSDTAVNRAVYRWGNGVTVYDRYLDAQSIVGRYGPIKL